ncbi:hypothetical protein SAMN05660657_05064 [Geodermatophilus amargosae]|uniref:Phage terminase, small subunit, putative, P27 family n=1 Tax=Geodermatophilus amargosae TaxID=1296565 RepID=A0A1I7CZ93_9ACTN|nr:hypothetical protein [Geodermatophilus amargosae]SFU04686.1 hypothetical protein SAMN05660657_05064 [Geodermatophilus amargosae]
MTPNRTPAGLRAPGRRLWRSVVDRFDLEPHELTLLEQAARTADVIAALDDVVAADGLLSATGRKPHPAVVEARQQRLVLGRLLAALRLPADDTAAPDVRPAGKVATLRGFYRTRGAS